MRNSINLSTFQAEYDNLVRKLRYRHPSHFDEFKYYQKEMFPDDMRTETELRRDYFRMAFKVEIRQKPEYSFLTLKNFGERSSFLILKIMLSQEWTGSAVARHRFNSKTSAS